MTRVSSFGRPLPKPVRALLGGLMLALGCAPSHRRSTAGAAAPRSSSLPDTSAALATITGGDLIRHMTVLASERFEGRAPGTAGEELTVAYVGDQLRAAGLSPGNPDGTYVQAVPLTGVVSVPALVLGVGAAPSGGLPALRHGDDFAMWSYGPEPNVRLARSELVFVGYGVVAPEFGWDDFKGVDVRGKTVVFLIGDPPVPDPADPSRLDPRMFRGPAMTYYGRWTHKYEVAAERGAAAALIVHETGPAGYGWGVVGSNAGRERFDIAERSSVRRHVAAEGWLHRDRAKELFAASGHDFDALKAAALRRDFHPTPLGAHATIDVANTFRSVRSRNVVGRIAGSDPAVSGEHVIYTAHWDHLGRDASRAPGDQVFAGALDNASGTAWLLEIAEAYARLPRAARRSVLFLSVTAEEYGLLGARYYAEHPLYPLERTLANVNMDVMNPWGRARSIVSLGHGQTTIDATLVAEAAAQGRRVVPDPEAEKGYYYRSDHFELARKGVPALGFLFPGDDYVDRPKGYGRRMREDYVARVYHTPLDVVHPDWDMSGAVEDTRLLFRVGLRIAEEDRWPTWEPGTEFRARREAMLAGARPR